MAAKTVKTIRKPMNVKVTDIHLRSIKRLSSQGMSIAIIAADVKLNRQTIMDNPKCKESFLAGKAILTKKITKAVLKRAGGDVDLTTDRMIIYACDKFGAMDGELIFDVPRTTQDAKKIMAMVTQAEAAGTISERKGDSIMKRLESFMKIIDVHELRKEIDELKEILDVKSIDL